jgi:hypothetical protein
MIRRKDEEHLNFATAQGRELYSFNVGDFYEIHLHGQRVAATMAESFWHSNAAIRPASRFGACCG